MSDVSQRLGQLDEIEKQVSAGLPPVGPQIISENPVNNQKTILLNVSAIFIIIVFVVISYVLIFSKKPPPKTNQIAQISPTSEEQAVVTLTTKYSNPFDSSTQYTNPFSTTNNPFTNISQ